MIRCRSVSLGMLSGLGTAWQSFPTGICRAGPELNRARGRAPTARLRPSTCRGILPDTLHTLWYSTPSASRYLYIQVIDTGSSLDLLLMPLLYRLLWTTATKWFTSVAQLQIQYNLILAYTRSLLVCNNAHPSFSLVRLPPVQYTEARLNSVSDNSHSQLHLRHWRGVYRRCRLNMALPFYWP